MIFVEMRAPPGGYPGNYTNRRPPYDNEHLSGKKIVQNSDVRFNTKNVKICQVFQAYTWL